MPEDRYTLEQEKWYAALEGGAETEWRAKYM
jgi:hypothetical protein